jgi:hypothetical protein
LASASGLLLQPDFLLRSGEALALGVLLSALCDRYLRLSFMLGIGLLVPRLGLRPLLRVPAVALNLILALLVRDLVLQRPALEFGLVFLCGRAGFVRALLRFVRVAGGVGLSLGLRPLQARARSSLPNSEAAVSFPLHASLPANPPLARSAFS